MVFFKIFQGDTIGRSTEKFERYRANGLNLLIVHFVLHFENRIESDLQVGVHFA